jgi:flotillin
MSKQNEYLQQVMDSQQVIEKQLKRKVALTPGSNQNGGSSILNYKITGFWRFKNVIVPPNMYVVHTRRGLQKPLSMGLGISFKYDPIRDSFLVVPSAMQTIVVNANGICKERQGIVVQSYVQWIIDDFSIAYQKLDFSDPVDPMSVVNIQLREQAEAVIKDVVSTMSIDTILSDKSPITKGLTSRLRELADGLGLKIVTVQIKEAVVSSTNLWDNLQKPFRSERAKVARLAELKNEEEVSNKEILVKKQFALQNIQQKSEIASREAQVKANAFNAAHEERIRRAKLEAEQRQKMVQLELQKIEADALLNESRQKLEIQIERMQFEFQMVKEEQQIDHLRLRHQIENDVSPSKVQVHLIESLPSIVNNLPQPNELTSISLGGTQLDGVISSVGSILSKMAAS